MIIHSSLIIGKLPKSYNKSYFPIINNHKTVLTNCNSKSQILINQIYKKFISKKLIKKSIL